MMFSIKDFFSKCGQILHIMIKHTQAVLRQNAEILLFFVQCKYENGCKKEILTQNGLIIYHLVCLFYRAVDFESRWSRVVWPYCLTPHAECWKIVKLTLNIFWCERCKIFKVWPLFSNMHERIKANVSFLKLLKALEH